MPLDDQLLFNPIFGRIYAGERFKAVFNLMNQSNTYPLAEMKMRVHISRREYTNDFNQTLLSENFEFFPASGKHSFVFEYIADKPDSYVLAVEIEYTSNYFKEQLRKLYGNTQNLPGEQKQQYRIDPHTKIVYRKFTKKYKFEAKLAFKLETRILLKHNAYILQAALENTSNNKIFVQGVKFRSRKTDCVVLSNNHNA